MNVGELIEKLKEWPSNFPVVVEAGGDGAIHSGDARKVTYDSGLIFISSEEE